MQFIANKQQDGQDGISWREELRNLADAAAIEDMDTADLLCIIYVTGIKNNELREKLLEISRPTIEKFDRAVDSFDQAKKQLDEMRSPAANRPEEDSSRRTRGKTTTAARRAARKPATKEGQVK